MAPAYHIYNTLIYGQADKARVFIPGKPFQPSVI